MHLFTTEHPPEIIAIQESNENCTIPGYIRFGQKTPSTSRPIHIFVKRNIPVRQHEIQLQGQNGAILVELLPRRKKHESLFVCNTYSPPKDHTDRVAEVFTEVAQIAISNPTIILGDFNAYSTTWGYRTDSKKGKAINRQVTLRDMVLLNDVMNPTRMGNSVNRDTNPDLAFMANIAEANWRNTGENLGSDHFILEITLGTQIEGQVKPPTCSVTDWDAFREMRRNRGPITSIEQWAKQVTEDQREATKDTPNPTQARTMDTRLQSMVEAYYSLYQRWKDTGKIHKKLRKRAVQLFRDIEEHAKYLNEQYWKQTCDGLKGQLHTKSPWAL
ncbi:hypothetical protein HPB47_028204 [Ixodes persulcatus]|uniref:Uncharacterized protein n=1 Tax=Ixodes persulcatus TaxID=34615 RepID=A0AC60PU64_IXOPE|nr:hypothetical protein HPB47_028204 [Ixodes persulcatus]